MAPGGPTAIVMLRLRRRPMASADNTKRTRTMTFLSAGVAVDAAALVAGHMSLLKLDDAPAHGVDDVGVVCRHDDRRTRPVDAIEQTHDADARGRVEVARGLVRQEDH